MDKQERETFQLNDLLHESLLAQLLEPREMSRRNGQAGEGDIAAE